MKKFELVVPAYNEEDIIEASIKKIYHYLSTSFSDDDWTLTVANNKSTDKTFQIAFKLNERLSRLKVIDVPLKGKGNAVYEAWKQSSADIVAFIDADLSIDVSCILQLINSISDDYPVVIASRHLQNSRVERDWIRSFTSKLYNWLANMILQTHLSDHQCGLKAMNRLLFNKIESQLTEREWFFDTELLYTLRQNNIKIKEIPVIWRESQRQSRVTSIKENAIKGLKLLFKLKNQSRKITKS